MLRHEEAERHEVAPAAAASASTCCQLTWKGRASAPSRNWRSLAEGAATAAGVSGTLQQGRWAAPAHLGARRRRAGRQIGVEIELWGAAGDTHASAASGVASWPRAPAAAWEDAISTHRQRSRARDDPDTHSIKCAADPLTLQRRPTN